YFRDNYLRVFSNEASGEPEYTSEVKRLSDGRWHGFIYNYGASQWVDYYDSQGTFTNFGDGEGWNMFETHYANALSNPQPDYCSYVPTISSEGFRLKNASQGWHLVGSSEVETWEQYYNGSQPQDCWGSPSEHTYYATSYNLGNDTLWQVFSY
ncbi:MAG: hypothetical protein JO270_08550, partial [Acidobacteriaceae bacterium]|nr:hypothetical protein [Acidobacteriaceae bacterium]